MRSSGDRNQVPIPSIRFMLGGAQKAGTTALARYLSGHPALVLPRSKEAHVFDSQEFDDLWGPREIDERFAVHFDSTKGDRLRGDATPITMFHPTLVARVARYNPAMKWLILLRDPVERAISHYFMERGRGLEARSLFAAVALEQWRLRKHGGDWSLNSPLRVCSYVARSRYATQLSVLNAHFPREQLLLLRSADLAQSPEELLAKVTAFLGVETKAPSRRDRVFEGSYRTPGRWSPGRLALRWALRGERRALADWGFDLECTAPAMHPLPRPTS